MEQLLHCSTVKCKNFKFEEFHFKVNFNSHSIKENFLNYLKYIVRTFSF